MILSRNVILILERLLRGSTLTLATRGTIGAKRIDEVYWSCFIDGLIILMPEGALSTSGRPTAKFRTPYEYIVVFKCIIIMLKDRLKERVARLVPANWVIGETRQAFRGAVEARGYSNLEEAHPGVEHSGAAIKLA